MAVISRILSSAGFSDKIRTSIIIADLIGFVDLFISESHSRGSTITDYPVEDGSKITDHVYDNPRELRLNGITTDLSFLSNVAIGGSINPRPTIAFQRLNQLKTSKKLLTVFTGIDVYTNMIIQDISTEAGEGSGGALNFTIQLKELALITNKLVQLPKEKLPDNLKAKATQTNLGVQQVIPQGPLFSLLTQSTPIPNFTLIPR